MIVRKMHFRSFFYLQLIVTLYANNVNIIRDYFLFKQVNGVVGFSCGNSENDYQIIRIFNEAGIAASIKQLTSNIDISQFLYSDHWNLGVFLDLQCSFTDDDVVKLFSETSAYYMFDHLHQWLILGESMNRTIQLLNDSVFSIITDVVISVPKNDDYILYDVYNHCKPCGGLLNITEFGSWRENDGLDINLKADKFSRRWNYHKMKVRVAGVVTQRPKDQILTEYLQEQNSVALTDNWPKFGYSLIVDIAEIFNFTLEVLELDHWEKNDRNGPLVTGLSKRIFDLGYYPSILTNERLNYADVITQVWPVRTCFMFLTVPSSKIDINIIFRPFSTNVWYMIFLLSFIIIFALWMILKVEKNVNNSDCGTTVLIIVAAMCQQGLPFVSNKWAGRVAFLHIMIFGLLVYNYYSAAIVSARLNAPSNKMNDSLYSLINSKMKLTAYKDIYLNFLLRAPVPEVQYFKKYWDIIPENKKFRPIEEGVKGIMNPRYAYHADPINVYPVIERMFSKQMICQLSEIHLFRPNTLGLWSTKNSPFREITKIGLIRIATAGIRKREVLRWTSRKPYCDKDKHYVSSVTIHETIPIILLLFIGIVLSAIICFIENIVFHVLQTKQRKENYKQVLQKYIAVIRKKIITKQ
ncbi:ionotropic receptor 75a [Osmia lignaria lignaria]|uniref:ionotropic receptor 75a n=1 Tax=Osmia lignaria lignaria TaxID=1437193 RepID=UPI001478FCE9|nr:ionotropic receptor 75a-like [Osmia lignaria]